MQQYKKQEQADNIEQNKEEIKANPFDTLHKYVIPALKIRSRNNSPINQIRISPREELNTERQTKSTKLRL